jgi:hypothetical protein
MKKFLTFDVGNAVNYCQFKGTVNSTSKLSPKDEIDEVIKLGVTHLG